MRHIDHMVTWQIKNVSVLSQGLWTPNLAGWCFSMRGPHTQCHVTLPHRVHLTTKSVIFPLSCSVWTPNLAEWWLLMKEIHRQSQVKDTSIVWSHGKSNILSSLSQGARSTDSAGWWLEWEDPTKHVMCHLDHALMWQLSSR